MEWAGEYYQQLSERAIREFPEADRDDALLALATTISPEEVYQEVIDASLNFVDREILASMLAVDVDELESVTSVARPGAGPSPQLAPVFLVAIIVLLVIGFYTVIPFDGLASDGARPAPRGLDRDDLRRTTQVM